MNVNGNEITITEEESKICKLDGKIFKSNREMIWHVRKIYNLSFEQYILKVFYNNQIPTCLKTGKILKFKANKLGPWFSNYVRNASPRKPHSEETKNKIKNGCIKTSMEKFGVENVFSTDWCKEKIKKTNLERYGVENIMKLDEMRILFSKFIKTPETIQKTKETTTKNYGVDHYFKTLEYKLSLRNKGFSKFYKNWDDYLFKLKENEQIKCISNESFINTNNPLEFQCILCNHVWFEDYLLMPECPKCREGFQNSRSMEEAGLLKWLSESIKEEIIPNKRFTFNGKTYEADVCIESKKTIIELNGLWWHSEIHGGKSKKYHLNKYNFFKSIGYNIIQIFEDEWVLKTNLVKSKILHKLGYNKNEKIYARKCEIKEIEYDVVNNFLNISHLQGSIPASVYLGAYYNNELVSVMTFSHLRICLGEKNTNKNNYEMIRFSTHPNKRIIGIAGKMLNYFIKNYNPDRIISYADKRWSYGDKNLYESIKMKYIGSTEPSYWYVKKLKREYRFNYTKQKLIEMGFDSSKTEWEIMQELGYDRIWDCGNFKYELIIDK